MTPDERARHEAIIRGHLDAGAFDAATESAIRGFGPEILGWLHGSLPGPAEAGDAFSLFGEHLWKSLPRFDGRCSMRTWCYVLARHAASRVRDARAAHRAVPLSDAPISELVAQVRETTLVHLRTEVKDRVRALREQLDPDDQTLLVLRVDKDLGWRDIAQVLAGPDAAADDVDRLSATLRKRFERVKQRLRELADET